MDIKEILYPTTEQAIKEIFRLMTEGDVKTETHLSIFLKVAGLIKTETKIDYSLLT